MLLLLPSYLAFGRIRDHLAFDRAEAAERDGDLPAATAALEPLIRRSPDDPAVNLLAARLGWRTQLAEPYPAGWDRPVRRRLAVALSAPWLVGRASGDEDAVAALTGDPAALRRVERRAAGSGPDAVAYLEAAARCHLDAHRPTAVVAAVDRLLVMRPTHAQAHFWRALATELAGRQRGEAEADFRRAVDLDPGRRVFRLHLALHLVGRTAELPEARRLLDGLLAETPDDPDVLRGLGTVLLLTDPAAAADPLSRLVQSRPGDGNARAMLGQVELEAGRTAEAERHLRAAVALSPGSYTANFQLYRVLAATGRAAEGQPFLTAAEGLKQDRERIATLAAEVAARPADPALRTELGRLYLKAGAESIGVYWLGTALEVDPAFAPAREALARRGGR